MESKLNDKFDVIVVGTGLIESILAAASARAGKLVLHLDPNDYYADVWASFSFEQLLNWIDLNQKPSSKARMLALAQNWSHQFDLKLGEEIKSWVPDLNVVYNVESVSYLLEEEREDEREEERESEDIKDDQDNIEKWSLSKMRKSKNWEIDLTPRLLYSKGSMVELLVSSNVCRYLSFQSVEKVLSLLPDSQEIIEVPCSRQDIFNDKQTSLIEKRILMRFITFCAEFDKNPKEAEEFEDMPFVEFLESKGLTPLLQHLIINSIAMCDNSTTVRDALKSIKKFLVSAGRYSKTPFLFTFYGSGEIPQAFCRLSAVFGGTYCLKKSIRALSLKEKLIQSVLVDNQLIKCDYLVTGVTNVPNMFLPKDCPVTKISRAIFITSESIHKAPREGFILRLSSHNPVSVIGVSWVSGLAPKPLYIVYCWCESYKEKAKQDLLPIAKKLFNFESSDDSQRPQLLWACFFNQNYINCGKKGRMTNNLFISSSPSLELDYDSAILEAKEIFNSMFPGEEFLPRAPDHDDIIHN